MNKIIRKWKEGKLKPNSLTDNEIEEIIDQFYKESFAHTKALIKDSLVNGWEYVKPSTVLKKDLIDQVNKNFPLKNSYNPKFDYSLVPEILNGITDEFTVISHDLIGEIEVGEFRTNFKKLALQGKSPISFKTYCNRKLTENKDLTAKTVDKIVNLFGKDSYDLSEVRYYGSHIPIKIYCNTCKSFFWIKIRKIDDNVRFNSCCPRCNYITTNRLNNKTVDEWIEKFKELHGDKYDYSLIVSIDNNYTKIPIKCNSCGKIFYQSPNVHLRSKIPCPCCRGVKMSELKRLTTDEVKERLEEIYGDMYDLNKLTYVNSNTPIQLTNNTTGEQISLSLVQLLRGQGRSDEDKQKSFGELCIIKWLKYKKIDYIREKIIKNINFESRKFIRVDFEITDRNIWIEYNGQQHYNFSSNYMFSTHHKLSSEEEFNLQVKRDEELRNYCKLNNITLIEIPYTYYTYEQISDVLERTLINHESPDFIIQPEIQYVDNKE